LNARRSEPGTHPFFNAEDAKGRQKMQKKAKDVLLRLLNPFGFPSALNPVERQNHEKSGRSRFPGSPGFPPARE
jgi:hypothetical protein